MCIGELHLPVAWAYCQQQPFGVSRRPVAESRLTGKSEGRLMLLPLFDGITQCVLCLRCDGAGLVRAWSGASAALRPNEGMPRTLPAREERGHDEGGAACQQGNGLKDENVPVVRPRITPGQEQPSGPD